MANPASSPVRIALIGIGKIARDQHLPVIAANADFDCVATVSTNARIDGLPGFKSIEQLLADGPAFDAVAICTPPQVRHGIARTALLAGKDVLMEKPPCINLSALADLESLCTGNGRVLYTTWHSRHAPAVETARAWLASRAVRKVRIEWLEDVRHWHPGQEWIWQAGGLGVFDPGINALSIATQLLPSFSLTRAELKFPSNRDTPIAADLWFDLAGGASMTATFDWRHVGTQTWDIHVETADGENLLLSKGGSELSINGIQQRTAGDDAQASIHVEYAAIYTHFAELIAQRQSDIDARPFRQVADAFLIGRRLQVEAFHEKT